MAGLGFEFTLLTSYLPYFTAAERRDEILRPEIKDFITHGTASSVNINIFASVALVPCNQQNSKMTPDIPISLHTHTFSLLFNQTLLCRDFSDIIKTSDQLTLK